MSRQPGLFKDLGMGAVIVIIMVLAFLALIAIF